MTVDLKRATFGDGLEPRTQTTESRPDRPTSRVRRRTNGEVEPTNEIVPETDECHVQLAINLIQGKWKARILSELQIGPARLSQLRKRLPAASKKMLTQHLRELEKDGFITRADLSDKLRHVEYSISDPQGMAALHMIRLLAEWGAKYRVGKALSGTNGQSQSVS
jgi:DNA-binding HxlR family transcriptional regulator